MLFLEAARHWRGLARNMMDLQRSYGRGRFDGVDGRIAAQALHFAKIALAAI